VSEHKPNAMLRGGPQPVGPRQVHATESAERVTWQAADGSGPHVWTRTGQFEEFAGGLLRVFVYEGPAEQSPAGATKAKGRAGTG
jgi:hypothetical protein